MTTRLAVLVHGWNDDPTEGWLGWLADSLRQSGWTVEQPEFSPQPAPSLSRWRAQLIPYLAQLDSQSIVVAHSLGCWLAAQFLSDLADGQSIASLYCVAGFFEPPRGEREHLAPEPDWEKLQRQIGTRVCYYSDSDKIVPPANTARLAEALTAELINVPNIGHFLGSRGVDKLEVLLDRIDHDQAIQQPS